MTGEILSGAGSATEAGAIADIAQAAADPKHLDPTKIYSVVLPADAEQDTLDLEGFLPAPRRATGTYHPATVASFVHYAANHRDLAHTTVWVDQLAHKLLAVLNDHAPGEAAWGDHRVELTLIKTPEWQHWIAKDGRYLNQEDFAEHLQDGILEIRDPNAATMLEIAQTVQGKTKADWKTARRLDNGEVSFAYQEEIQASAGRSGHLEIPATFTLAIAPFYGEQPYEIGARLRYRIREGNLSIGYKLDRPHEVLVAVLGGMATRLREQDGFPNVYIGTPR